MNSVTTNGPAPTGLSAKPAGSAWSAVGDPTFKASRRATMRSNWPFGSLRVISKVSGSTTSMDAICSTMVRSEDWLAGSPIRSQLNLTASAS